LNGGSNNTSNQRANNNSRAWEAQGNSTDRGRSPQGFGSSNSPANNSHSGRVNRADRPSWSGSGAQPRINGSPVTNNNNRPANSGGNRTYEPPQRNVPSYNGSSAPRSYAPPQRNVPSYNGSSAPRSYAPPTGSYSPPARSYSAPSSPSYSAPSRTYSAPSRSYGGGGGGGGSAPHGGGGGSTPHGGGGSSAPHSSGGGGGRPHR
jgi:hypothetical protein